MMNLKLINRIELRMRGLFNYEIPNSIFIWMQILVSLLFCLIPLFRNLSYEQNFFLTWEGAYRLTQGQIPYRDFGIPLGIGFWLVPALFFNLFGPFFVSLLKAQVFLNLISLASLRVIFKKLGFSEAAILLILLVNCTSFVYINNWPWYNHTVYVFQLLSIMFLVLYFSGVKLKFRYMNLVFCALISTLAFFTKQDGGAFSILINGILIVFYVILFQRKKFFDIGVFGFFIFIFLFSYILFFKNYDFGYWFNYGQFPHYSRMNLWDIIDKFFGDSLFLKFYIAFAVIAIFYAIQKESNLKFDEISVLAIAICFLMLLQVIVIQVTSFSPAKGTLYFHTFGVALIIYFINLPFRRMGLFLISALVVLVLFSDTYWNTIQKQIRKILPSGIVMKSHDVVSLNTWATTASDSIMPVNKVYSEMETLRRLRIPEQTLAGIDSICNLQVFKDKQSDIRILNMSELTFLAYEMNYQLLSGSGVPLWYHKGVCLFDREIVFLCGLIKNKKFDIILFESMDYVQDFYPFAVRDCAIENYVKVFEFEGPTGVGNVVEVFVVPD